NKTGDFYFTCTFQGHCNNGQKLSVKVSASSPAPAQGPSPTPPSGTTPTPPSPTPPSPTPPSGNTPTPPSPTPPVNGDSPSPSSP
ncbi:blue copper protein, partial [Trifolium medium]|nr:blue copper protein [Trifolium medium]